MYWTWAQQQHLGRQRASQVERLQRLEHQARLLKVFPMPQSTESR